MALMLIRDGYAPEDAINLMRGKRGQAVLANKHFEKWLMELDVEGWREKSGSNSSNGETKLSNKPRNQVA
jgi:hypothetical protein